MQRRLIPIILLPFRFLLICIGLTPFSSLDPQVSDRLHCDLRLTSPVLHLRNSGWLRCHIYEFKYLSVMNMLITFVFRVGGPITKNIAIKLKKMPAVRRGLPV